MDNKSIEKLDENNSSETTVVINKENPCEEFKTKLSMCMKNSDDNIIACQSLRDIYENCLREQDKIIR